jgi:hypothetical protein
MSQGYADYDVVSYGYGLYAFTAGLTASLIPPLRNNRAVVLDIHVNATIVFTQVATPAFVRLGTVGTPAKYAELNMAATAAGAALNLPATGKYNPSNTNAFVNIDLVRDGVSAVQLLVVAMTGGSPTGTGYLNVALGWS